MPSTGPCLNLEPARGRPGGMPTGRAVPHLLPAGCYDKIGAAIESYCCCSNTGGPICSNTAEKAPDKDQHSVRQNLQGGMGRPCGGACGPAVEWRPGGLHSRTYRSLPGQPMRRRRQLPPAWVYYKTLAAELDYWAAKKVQDPNWELLRLLGGGKL